MIKFLLYLYKVSFGANEKNSYKVNSPIKWFLSVSFYVVVRFLFNNYVKARGLLNLSTKMEGLINEQIVVSLTTFPARIGNVWMVIDSICRQKMRPFTINLYLSEKDFLNKHSIPKSLEKYQKMGLKICWVKENLMPHKKYYYAFQDYPDKYVITVDDDTYYRDDMISRLWSMNSYQDKVVCANRATPILNKKLQLLTYNQWGKENKAVPGVSFNYLAIGTCGVLYPPHILREATVFDKDSIYRNCLRADDLWLKCHELLNKIPVKTGDFYSQSIDIPDSQTHSLRSINCNDSIRSGNDIQWANLNREYGLNKILLHLVMDEK